MAFRSKVKGKFGKVSGKVKVPMCFVGDVEDGEDEDNPFTMGGGGGSGGALPKKHKMKQAVVSAFGVGSEDAVVGSTQEVRSYDQEDLLVLKSTQNFQKAEAALAAALGVGGAVSNDVADTDLGIIMEGDAAEEAEFSGVVGAGAGGSRLAQTQAEGQEQAQGVTQQTQSFQKLASQASSGGGSVNIHSMLELLQSSVKEAEDLGAGEGRRAALLSEQLAALAVRGDAEDPSTKARVLQARVVLLGELHSYSHGVMGTLGANEVRVEALVGAAMDVRGTFTAATEDSSRVAVSEGGGKDGAQRPGSLAEAEAETAFQMGMGRLREAGALLLQGTSMAQICEKFAYLRRNLPDLYASAYLDDCLEIALTPMVTHRLALLDPFAVSPSAEHGDGHGDGMEVERERASRPLPGLSAGLLGDPLALEAVLALVAAGPAAPPTAGLDSESSRGGLLAGLVKAAVLPWLRRCVTAFFSPYDASQCEQLRLVLADCHQALGCPNQGADVETSEAVFSAFRQRMLGYRDMEVEVEGAEEVGSGTATTTTAAAAQAALLAANLKALKSVLPDAQTAALLAELVAISSSSSSKTRRLSRFDEAPVQ